jgi:uncharacterized membrane protein YhaH (DUF805 family)
MEDITNESPFRRQQVEVCFECSREDIVQIGKVWKWEGRMDRQSYLLVGASALALKMGIDWFVVSYIFHRTWSVLLYWHPLGTLASVSEKEDAGIGFVLLVSALPFIWLGLTTTVKRLRDAGEPVWPVCFFFVPLVNVLFFAVLCLIPSAQSKLEEGTVEDTRWLVLRTLDDWVPGRALGSALVSIVVTTLLGLGLVVLSTHVLFTYGWGLFVALPFCLGLFSALLYSYPEPRRFAQCVNVAMFPVVILGIVLLLVAIEGAICVLMAAPIALLLAFFGGSLGFSIQVARWGRKNPATLSTMFSIVLIGLPSLFGYEHSVKPDLPQYRVQSEIVVNAPPEAVWKEVIAFSQIPPPTEWLFRSGIAYPMRAEMEGAGVGAVRRCVFSTGPFVEPIDVWQEPKLLRFQVAENPAPLNEMTPYGHIEPAHLHGYFLSRQGQFELTELPGGNTRLTGTTWYTNQMWPQQYWRLWSDYIVHKIHMRVLTNIRKEVESRVRSIEEGVGPSVR